MTRILKFYGVSDDLFEVEGTTQNEPDEIECYSGGVAVKVTTKNAEGLIVSAVYAPNCTDAATWVIGIANLDDGINVPAWPIRLESRTYSPVLILEAPDDAFVEEIKS